MRWPTDEAGRVRLKQLGRADLEDWVTELGLPAYRGRQLFSWIYGKAASSFDSMTDLPVSLRDHLASKAILEPLEPVADHRSSSDDTIKALFRLSSGRHIETVLIPDFEEDGNTRRMTVCVSSQVGCAMGCTFCATGRMGFQQDLSPGEITEQVLRMDQTARETFGTGVSNVVFMGMGEPLMNYDAVIGAVEAMSHPDGFGLSPKRITVSTVGLAKRIKRLADDAVRFNLAISLHAPTDSKRSSIMPVNRSARTDLAALRESVAYFYSKLRRPVTYEYCMLSGYNDTVEDAEALARVTRWAPSKVNLIMYNSVSGSGFEPTSESRLNIFIRALVERGVRVTVRRSRGQDIEAACGQLATAY
jgi:23S rRNA (adenine2503-C2)-methyltransferase